LVCIARTLIFGLGTFDGISETSTDFRGGGGVER
jgi:hypothetical protein